MKRDKSTIKKLFRIGCFAILAIAVISILSIAAFSFWASHKINTAKSERAELRIEKTTQLHADLNAGRITGLNDFDIAFAGCDVYRATSAKNDWSEVALEYSRTDYAKVLTGCTSARAWIEGEWLYVYTCAQAIGAGGGCARGGTFKTHNGKQWLRREGNNSKAKWIDTLPSQNSYSSAELVN